MGSRGHKGWWSLVFGNRPPCRLSPPLNGSGRLYSLWVGGSFGVTVVTVGNSGSHSTGNKGGSHWDLSESGGCWYFVCKIWALRGPGSSSLWNSHGRRGLSLSVTLFFSVR